METSHKRQQRVLEHEHHHRRERAHAAEQDQWRAVEQRGNNQDRAENIDHDLQDLDESRDGPAARFRPALVNHVPCLQHRYQRQRDHQDHPGIGHVVRDVDDRIGQVGHQPNTGINNDRRHNLREPPERVVLDQRIIPVRARVLHQLPH